MADTSARSSKKSAGTVPPSRKRLFQYSLIALPLSFAGLPLYIHAPDFYTRNLGMDLGLIGTILLAIRLFDAVQDPVIGYVSDKFSHARKTILMIGCAALTLGIISVFHGPLDTPFSSGGDPGAGQDAASLTSPMTLAIWFAVSMMLATSGFSILSINLNTIGGFWERDVHQRTRISAWREILGLIGILMAAVTPDLFGKVWDSVGAYEGIILVFSLTMAAGLILFLRFLRALPKDHAVFTNRSRRGFYLWPILKGPDRSFFLICFLTHLAAALPGILVLFFINDYLQLPKLTGAFLFFYFAAGALMMPGWVALARRMGKNTAWLASMILAVVTFVWATFLGTGDAVEFAIISALSGMALGADLALPPAILADRVDRQNTETEGTQYYGLLAFIPKIALALTSGTAFMILDRLGFEAGTENAKTALDGLIYLYALVPCLIKALAALCLFRMIRKEGTP